MLTWVHGSDQILNRAIPELQKRELILEISREPEQVNSFKHVLTQETVYSSLLRRKSEQFHLRAAEYLENTNSEQFNEIARHFLEGGEEFQAATYLVKAGDRAAQAYSTPEAVEYYSKALEILVTGGESDLTRRSYEGLGGAFILANDIESTVNNYQEMLEYANSQDDTPMQVSALNKLAQIEGQWLGQFDQAIDNIFSVYNPQVIAVHTTCLSETIGDDLPQIFDKARKDKKVPDGKTVLGAATPSYVGSHVTGFSNMVKAMAALAETKKPQGSTRALRERSQVQADVAVAEAKLTGSGAVSGSNTTQPLSLSTKVIFARSKPRTW